MPQAKRIQRSRTKGWKMPPNTVYVGRPTKWGNPYPVKCFSGGMAEVVPLFSKYLRLTPYGIELAAEARSELRGKDLACWCPLDAPCHADVLLEIANDGDAA